MKPVNVDEYLASVAHKMPPPESQPPSTQENVGDPAETTMPLGDLNVSQLREMSSFRDTYADLDSEDIFE
jgi:hypothetical protein